MNENNLSRWEDDVNKEGIKSSGICVPKKKDNTIDRKTAQDNNQCY